MFSFQTIIEKPSCLLLDFEPSVSAPKADDISANVQPDPPSPSPPITSTIVIEVRPAAAENTLELDSELKKDMRWLISSDHNTALKKNEDTSIKT